VFGGLLKIRDLNFTAYTNGLPQRFVLQAEPAGDGSVWVAGFKTETPRGPCWLRRYHPDSGTSAGEVVVPGHIRRLVVVTNGVWMATSNRSRCISGMAMRPRPRWWEPSATLRPHCSSEAGARFHRARRHARGGMASTAGTGGERSGSAATGQHFVGCGVRNFGVPGRHAGPAPRRWMPGWASPMLLARVRGDRLEEIPFAEDQKVRRSRRSAPTGRAACGLGPRRTGCILCTERLVRVFTTKDGLSGNDVRSVSAAPDGGLWVATGEGLNHVRNGQVSPHGKGRLRAVASDGQGRPWFGLAMFGEGALQRTGAGPSGTAVLLGLQWQDPNSLRFGRDGTLWVACERGLTWLRPERLVKQADGNWMPDPASTVPVFGRYSVGGELPKMWPVGLVEDADGSMWMGSLANGLFHVAKGRVEVFTVNDGLPGNHCVPVYRDDAGAIWIVTPPGFAGVRMAAFRASARRTGSRKTFCWI